VNINITMASRKTSLTLIDLEAFKDLDQKLRDDYDENAASTDKYYEHSEIFDDICQEAEAEDQLNERRSRPMRRPSLSGVSGGSSMEWEGNVAIESLRRRRHSTFNSRNRAAHRKEHADLEEHLKSFEDKHRFRRASFVNNLLEFSVNFDVSMSNAAMGHEISPALNFSCPVLSYMHDDEEDSVEILMLRRPSLISSNDDSKTDSWESLKDDGETDFSPDAHEMSREYVIELPSMEEVVKPKGKRRRPHSYQMLEKRLTCESQSDVIKSFSLKEMTASYVAQQPRAPIEPKSLDHDVPSTFQSSSEQPLAARQQCARGA